MLVKNLRENWVWPAGAVLQKNRLPGRRTDSVLKSHPTRCKRSPGKLSDLNRNPRLLNPIEMLNPCSGRPAEFRPQLLLSSESGKAPLKFAKRVPLFASPALAELRSVRYAFLVKHPYCHYFNTDKPSQRLSFDVYLSTLSHEVRIGKDAWLRPPRNTPHHRLANFRNYTRRRRAYPFTRR